MPNTGLEGLRTWLTSDDPRRVLAARLGVAMAAGLLIGALLGWLGPLLALAALGALAVGLALLRSIQWGLLALIALICLLPYAALPLNIGFQPTLIDLVLLMLFGVWLMHLVTGRQRTFETSAVGMALLAFIVWTLVTFVAGLAHAPASATVLRRFLETQLAIFLFFVVINQVRDESALRRLSLALIICGGLAGFLGIVFYVLPESLTVSILSRLAILNYPSGAGILRYVEDDPNQPMRAIATSADPNALGGLLVVVTSVAGVQLFAGRPVLRRRWLLPLTGMMGICLLLTYSRGSLIGLVVALFLAGLVRYRKLLLLLILAAGLLLVLPQTQPYVARLVAGLQGQDLATQMRFGEYKDALILIGRYPLLGVGFTGTPDIDLYIGVSSLYLLIAEQVGLIGLFLYLVVMAVFFVVTWRAARRTPGGSLIEGQLLAGQAALVGALVGGVFDHFFFNINFIHLVALFWLIMGMAVSAARLAAQTQGSSGGVDDPARTQNPRK